MMKVKGSYTVTPAESTPAGKLWLSEIDQYMPLTHTQTVYFYRAPLIDNPIITTTSAMMDTMRDSLSKVLVQFYPLAGRLQWIEGGRLELDCNSMGAQVFEAESDMEISDFGDFSPTPKMRELVPHIDYSQPINELPLFLVQLTQFSCGGSSVGVAISHAVADGQSALQFINTWAKVAARGGENLVEETPLPFIDRTVLRRSEHPPPTPRFNHPEFGPPPVLIGQTDEKEERKKETTVVMLKLTRDQVEKLKKKANAETMPGCRPYTRYESMAAHIWRCASKAHRHECQQLTLLRIAVDSRNRLRPVLPNNFFGNTIFVTNATSRAGELMGNPLGFAASRIREAVDTMTDEYFKSAIDFLGGQEDMRPFRTAFHTVGCTQGAFLGNPNVAIASWLGLPIYGADFGWGKPIYMGPVSLGFDGRCFIVPGPDHDEDGSFTILLRLIAAHMEDFKKFFYGDI
ncbi:spermidine hydroxycinnamoyl transferase-like [Telopea speciosissima]|uniref:spermidine hydroxycinnamoyl transferase-like n=1 Tax=Telopea speciosissima TaxID=54955 RepID=UPI001CC51EF5|nr:spermidine hydroxycinnamoyl transferase-like [Telopea speciosissima]